MKTCRKVELVPRSFSAIVQSYGSSMPVCKAGRLKSHEMLVGRKHIHHVHNSGNAKNPVVHMHNPATAKPAL